MAIKTNGTVTHCSTSDTGTHAVKVHYPEPPPGEDVVYGDVPDAMYKDFYAALLADDIMVDVDAAGTPPTATNVTSHK